MLGWTGAGQKSNHCQAYVQATSSPCPTKEKYRVYPDDVQAWSTVCQASADFHRTWTEVGPQNPRFVQALSNHLGKPHFSSLDKLWTNFWPRKTTIRVHMLMIWKHNFALWTDVGQFLDMDWLWTKSGFQLVCSQIEWKWYFFVDKLWTRTYCGQSLDFSLFAPKSSESEIFLWTEIGQPLYLDRPWTKYRYQLSCLRNPKVPGEVQTLSRVCLCQKFVQFKSNG